MGYVDKLSKDQLENVNVLIKAFPKWGITNLFTQAAILAIVSKESSFNYRFEKGYGNTSNDRIRKIFGRRVSHLNDDQLTKTKKDDEAFFNLIYGNRYGNGPDEGYKYRGGGPNQLTFKGNYEATAKHIDVDLVAHPEMVNDPEVAADIVCSYMVRAFKRFSPQQQRHYNSKDLNDFKNFNDACLAVYHANAGFGKPVYTLAKANESTGGLKKAIARTPEFLRYIKNDNTEVAHPFKTKEDGNRFRAWVNDNHPEVAKEIDLDREGSHTNSYIMNAYEQLGAEYEENK